MKVLLLSRYGRMGASSRVRSYQYLPYLHQRGMEITVAPLLRDDYVRRLYRGGSKNWLNIGASYARRIWQLSKAHRYNLLWIEKELFPWLPAWGEKLLGHFGIPYVVDYDDAVFHRYDLHSNRLICKMLGSKIDQIMRGAALVMVGNQYLAGRAIASGAQRVKILPTVVDLARYRPAAQKEQDTFKIGWIGTPGTAHYLELVAPALAELCKEGGSQVVLVGSGSVPLRGLPLEIRPWSEESEVAEIQNFDVGIMPLPDGPWERGKCGYKLIQYLACGKPVVASAVGINGQIITSGANGYLAESMSDWVIFLRKLRDNPDLRSSLGRVGRAKVAREYSLQVSAPRLLSWFCQVVYG